MFYVKNMCSWDRVMRLVLGLAIAVAPFVVSLPYTWLWVLSGASFALITMVGWCPMCAAFGVKPPAKEE
jgi:hypothetical protein